MRLAPIDWAIVAAFLLLSLLIGLAVMRRAGRSTGDYFLSGRAMPWWLLGVGMVATTFSADTPNLVTDIVRTHGVAGNWVWWAFLLTGMTTTFVYARLWRRAGIDTDLGFYELRYSGRSARFLRAFRAVYLGVFFNIMIMASVNLAAIKIGAVLLGLDPVVLLIVAGTITVVYSMLGGLTGVLLTDFFQFLVAMVGAVVAAVWALGDPRVGGLGSLLQHPDVAGRLALLPDFTRADLVIPIFLMPLAVQWWSVWYPGAEPGGGGYIAQRMLAARSEGHAQAATLLFNVAHYALRPWPWILVALASLILFPDLATLQAAFPHVDARVLGHDLAYPAMLTLLPAGLLGLVVASLTAAYMSTISTHLNWGASYVVHDVVQRFLDPDATQQRLVRIGRITTALLMAASCLVALGLTHALQAFQILLQIGAGTGLLFLLRWFWWRINALSEIVAMGVSFAVALWFQFLHAPLWGSRLPAWQELCLGVAVTSLAWIATALLTRPDDPAVLRDFVRRVRPDGAGWRVVREAAARDGEILPRGGELPAGLLCALLGTLGVYAALFAGGLTLYGRSLAAMLAAAAALACGLLLTAVWRRAAPPTP